MWKLIGIVALVLQLSTNAAVTEQIREVALKFEPNTISDEDMEFLDCFLMQVKSSKDQVVVTSTTLEMEHLKSLNKSLRVEIIGNANYPEYFPKNLGQFITGVHYFIYKKSPLKYIKREDFNVIGQNLILINLMGSQIEEIPFDTFYDFPKLTYLDIRENKLKSLPSNLLAKLPNLNGLYIESNEITALSPDLFKNCPDFYVLYAEFNKIEEFHEDLFKNNPKMTIISMRHNKIRNIPIDFNRFELLDVADFTHNGDTCDTMFFRHKPYNEYYDEEEQKKWIKTVPEFQQKIEEVCRQQSQFT